MNNKSLMKTKPVQINTLRTRKSTKHFLTHRDLIRISTFMFGNIDSLAEACNITDTEIDEIKTQYTRTDTCALKILEKWTQDNPHSDKQDLHKLLLFTKQKHAAKRYTCITIYITTIHVFMLFLVSY